MGGDATEAGGDAAKAQPAVTRRPEPGPGLHRGEAAPGLASGDATAAARPSPAVFGRGAQLRALEARLRRVEAELGLAPLA